MVGAGRSPLYYGSWGDGNFGGFGLSGGMEHAGRHLAKLNGRYLLTYLDDRVSKYVYTCAAA